MPPDHDTVIADLTAEVRSFCLSDADRAKLAENVRRYPLDAAISANRKAP